MDPITAATTFSTLVSLLADFVASRDATSARSYEEFVAWLSANRHEELLNSLRENSRTSIGIKALLGENQREILDRLEMLDKALASYASGFAAFRDIAGAAHPSSPLSQQAVSILEQFNDSGASGMLEHHTFDGIGFAYLDAKAPSQLLFEEPRFVEDDMNTLLELGLLDLSHNKSGNRIFKFTRAAARFVEQLRSV